MLTFLAAVGAAQTGFSRATARGDDARSAIRLPGASVHGYQVTLISAKLGGFVESIGEANKMEVDVGSRVKKGTVLAKLDIPEMENELAEKEAIVAQVESAVLQAESAVIEAKAEVTQRQAALEQVRAGIAEKRALLKLRETTLKRLTRLADGGTIGEDHLDEAKFEVEAAKAALQSVDADIRAAEAGIKAAEASVARANADKASAEAKVRVAEAQVDRLNVLMQYTVIEAPYDGIITKRMVDIGAYVQPAENNSAAMPLFELTQIDRVRIRVAVPNSSVARVQPGQTVEFGSIGGLEGRSFRGTITRSAGALDPQTRTMQIECHLANPAMDSASGEQVELKPGLYGTLSVLPEN